MALGRSGVSILLVALGLLAACDLNPPEPRASQGPPELITHTPQPSPSPTVTKVWALWPLGVKIHVSPSLTAAQAGVAQQSDELDVQDHKTVDGKTWFKVTSQDANVNGWVLDDPDLLIHQAVDIHIDSQLTWSTLFPSGWNEQDYSGETKFTGDGGTYDIAVSRATPSSLTGNAEDFELYGKPARLWTLSGGPYRYVVRARWDAARYFSIGFAGTDESLFKQLVTSIKID